MNTTIINTENTTAKSKLNNTILSAYRIQSELNTQLEKITFEVESVIDNKDFVASALNRLSERGYVPVSLDKYEVELAEDESTIKVKFEFSCKKPLVKQEVKTRG